MWSKNIIHVHLNAPRYGHTCVTWRASLSLMCGIFHSLFGNEVDCCATTITLKHLCFEDVLDCSYSNLRRCIGRKRHYHLCLPPLLVQRVCTPEEAYVWNPLCCFLSANTTSWTKPATRSNNTTRGECRGQYGNEEHRGPGRWTPRLRHPCYPGTSSVKDKQSTRNRPTVPICIAMATPRFTDPPTLLLFQEVICGTFG